MPAFKLPKRFLIAERPTVGLAHSSHFYGPKFVHPNIVYRAKMPI